MRHSSTPSLTASLFSCLAVLTVRADDPPKPGTNSNPENVLYIGKGNLVRPVAAGPLYRLLGAKDLGVTVVPVIDKPVTTGNLAFHHHSGGHTAVPADWKACLEFAERHYQVAAK